MSPSRCLPRTGIEENSKRLSLVSVKHLDSSRFSGFHRLERSWDNAAVVPFLIADDMLTQLLAKAESCATSLFFGGEAISVGTCDDGYNMKSTGLSTFPSLIDWYFWPSPPDRNQCTFP